MPIYPPLAISRLRVLRLATLEDLPNLVALELECFDEIRRDTRSTIRKSLVNSQNETWVKDCPSDQRIGVALSLRKVHNSLRIYSLATHPEIRGQGWGNYLLSVAQERARARGCRQIRLEADASHSMLLDWYERNGFKRVKFLEDYYDHGCHAWEMVYIIG
ncbi:MAG: N-acetyltransferase [Verrucomicrobia bacterium]|nr:N-acetyltransferase [Verrucomicrobiota bacterium]